MPKSKGRKRQLKQIEQQLPLKKTTAHWSRTQKFVVGALTITAAVIGIVAGIVGLLPRVNVQTSGPFDPLHPFPIPFTITNNGSITLYNVHFFIGLCTFIWGPADSIGGATLQSERPCNGPSTTRITNPTWFVQKFEVDQQYVMRYDDIIPHPSTDHGMTIHSAEMSIVIEYQPWDAPWPTREKEFRYKTRKDEDGKLSWIPQPLNK
jgi:hypothetical protein